MALPGSGYITMSQIAGELQGANDLAYYRGRTYWRNGSQVTISQNPTFAEFYGLQLGSGAPVLNRHPIYAVDMALHGNMSLAYRPRTGELWVTNNNGGAIKSWNSINLVNPYLYQSLNINYTLMAGAGLIQFNIDQGQGTGHPDDYNIIGYGAQTDGTIIRVDLTGNPK